MRRLLILTCAVVFLDVTFFAVLTPLLPTFKADHHLTEGATGMLAGVFAAGSLLASLPAGWMAARVGPRTTVITGLAGIGIFSPIFGFANDIVILDLARGLQGASGALMWAGSISWLISAAPSGRRGQLLGTVMAAAVVGELLGAPIGAVAHVIGTGPVFGVVFFLALGLIAASLTIPEQAEAAGQRLGEAVSRMAGSLVPRALLMLAAPACAFGLIVVMAPLRMDELGASAFLIAAAFASGSVVEAILGPVIGRLSDRIGRTAPYFIGAMIVSGAVVVLGAFGVLPVLFGAVVIAAFGAGLAFTPASALATEAASVAGVNQGYASGGANVAWAGGQMVGAVGGGALAGLGGFLVPSLIAAGFVAVVALMAKALTEPVLQVTGEHAIVTAPGDDGTMRRSG